MRTGEPRRFDFGLSRELIEELRSPACRTILLIGSSDSGKTSLIESLYPELISTALGIVDLDAGQSRIGPPATVAWGRAPVGELIWERVKPVDYYFTGGTSPVGNLLPTLTGAAVVCRAAAGACDKIIIDTSGLIGPGPGWALKTSKIDLIQPDVILALHQGDELEPLLDTLKGRRRPLVNRLKTPPGVRVKTATARTRHRARAFRRYFENARLFTVDWGRLGLDMSRLGRAGQRIDLRRRPFDLSFRLVGLRDADGRDLAVGTITAADIENQWFEILTPLGDPTAVSSVVFGRLRVAPSGEQLA